MDDLNHVLASRHFWQIPGPNPILGRGGAGEWDESCIECCDVLKDFDIYYLYYHGVPADAGRWPRGGYRLGVATAAHPLGPWTKHPGNPVLDLGPEGSWEDRSVACAFLLKEGTDRYYLWYSGCGQETPWSVGLARGLSPLGPWEKYEGNPILPGFGYVGGVVRHEGRYYLYTEHPIGATGPDYGPISLATADAPEGPWTPHPENPVLAAGDWGAWDDGGFSEAKVAYRDGVFHLFYGAAKLHPTRILSQESIGYAYSLDGVYFTKHPDNPVARREANPDAAAFAEVHCLLEPPLVYLYHTLRYLSSDRPNIEDLGVQVLATARPFRIAMPVLHLAGLAAGTSSPSEGCPPVALEHVSTLALTVECVSHTEAQAGLRVHIRTSTDGFHYDTVDYQTFDLHFAAGGTVQQTVALNCPARFLKVLAENLDPGQAVKDVRIMATLGG
jgi:hypothetical protein